MQETIAYFILQNTGKIRLWLQIQALSKPVFVPARQNSLKWSQHLFMCKYYHHSLCRHGHHQKTCIEFFKSTDNTTYNLYTFLLLHSLLCNELYCNVNKRMRIRYWFVKETTFYVVNASIFIQSILETNVADII